MPITIKGRNEGRKQARKKILIVCEGEKTEPSYFSNFKVAKEVCDIQGTGANTLSLVKQAQKIADKGDYQEVWCVFDRDSFPKKNITSAFKLAQSLGYKCAFSNESFELWYVLHFQYLDTQISRSDYCTRLSTLLNAKYAKNSTEMYGILKPRQETAIKNAEAIEKAMNPSPNGSLFDAQPITTVHHLVKKLMAMERINTK